jgi:NAD(P)-dependent dehydrogenase (short-subunit alcohol dehydrogenase family)
MENFQGKVAFVTGGASGIGLGMVRNFLGEGMKVVVADNNPLNLTAAREALAGSNAVHFIRVDVADRERLRLAAQEALATFGRIHLLCNNAGVAGGGQATDPEFDDWDHALAINLGGVVNGCKIIAPIIRAQGEGGHIVNTGSMAGLVPLPGLAAYSTAKYAVRGYSESLRMALAPDGIGVSCLCPGATQSALLKLPNDLREASGDEAGTYQRQLWAAMRAAMDPVDLGGKVIEAIRANRFLIVTHGEFLEEVRALHHEIEESFPDARDVPEARIRFEQTRRRITHELMHMEARD